MATTPPTTPGLHVPAPTPAAESPAAESPPRGSGVPQQVSLHEVLAGTSLADRLLVQRTHGGRVLHLIPAPDPQDRRYRPGVAVALCGAGVYFDPGTQGRDPHQGTVVERPGCRRCLAVLRELTSAPDADGIRWSASAGGSVLHAWTPLSPELAAAHDGPQHRAASLRLPPVRAACSKVFTPDPGAALSMRARDARRTHPLPRCERCQVRLAARDGRLPPPADGMLF